jgi:hypothetical protein
LLSEEVITCDCSLAFPRLARCSRWADAANSRRRKDHPVPLGRWARSDLPVRWVLPDLRGLKAHKDLSGRKAPQESGVKPGPVALRGPSVLKALKGRPADRDPQAQQVKEGKQDLRVPPVLSVRLVQAVPLVHLDRKVHPVPQDRLDSRPRALPQ